MPNIVLLSGDGIGPEIIAEASRVLDRINEQYSLQITAQTCLIGGAAIDVTGEPLPEETLSKAKTQTLFFWGLWVDRSGIVFRWKNVQRRAY